MITALYCRLSLEDGKDNESMSISRLFLYKMFKGFLHGLCAAKLPRHNKPCLRRCPFFVCFQCPYGEGNTCLYDELCNDTQQPFLWGGKQK